MDITSVASRIDELAFMPSQIASKAMDRFFARRQNAAGNNSEWAAIEARRHSSNKTTTTLLSDNLTLADWETQNKIAQAVLPAPGWMTVAQRAQRWTLARAAGNLTTAWQRATRGWATRDTYNLDGYLATMLAGMLNELADNAHGWPQSDEFETFESWTETLRTNAQALSAYSGDAKSRQALDDWHNLVIDSNSDPVATQEAFARMEQYDVERIERGRAALMWVATHLEQLWD